MAIKFPAANTTSYIDCGTISIPTTGDWAIFYGLNNGALSSAQCQTHISIGTASDTILSDASNIVIGTGNATAANAYDINQLFVSGKDSASVDLGTRPLPNHMGFGTSINVQSGYFMTNSGNTLVVLQKRGNNIELWQVIKNRTAVLIYQTFAMGAFAGLTAKPLLIGVLNRLAVTGFLQYSTAIQRFGKVAQSLNPGQMHRILSGADPVALLGMTSGAGDLYWAFDNAAAISAGNTFTDAVQSQVATAVGGSWQTPTQIIPLTEATSDIRLLQRDVYHTPVSPGPIRLDGSYRSTGVVTNVQVQLLNSSTQAVLKDWQTIASNVSGGTWTGTLTGVTRQLLDYELQIRLVIDGVTQASQTGYVCQSGVVISQMGQSLNEYLRYNSVYSTAIPANIYSNVASTVPPTAGTSNYITAPTKSFPRGLTPMWRFLTGYGEVNFANIISVAAQCRVVICNDSRQGTTVANWTTDNNAVMSRAVESIVRYGGAFVIWEQGQADQGGGYAAKLTSLYTALTNAISDQASIQFGVSPIAVSLDASSSSSGIYSVRIAQKTWITGFSQTLSPVRRRAMGRPFNSGLSNAVQSNNVFLADNSTNDITLVDFIHETTDISGAGRMVERWAQTILKMMGVTSFTGLGPEITSARWDGSLLVTVTVTHNGGTALQTPNVADVTGFEVSSDGGGSWIIPNAQVISGSNTITLTLASIPAQIPQVRYQFGGPGPQPTGGQTSAQRRTQAMIDNPVFDNRSPALNTSLGYPVGFTVAPIICTT